MFLPDFPKGLVLVVGDLMLDRYWQGETARISPEAPVPVVRIDSSDERAGGAGNVALNLAALGSRVRLLGPLGNDEPGHALVRQLKSGGVEVIAVPENGIKTITKLRILSRHQQLIRLDFEPGTGGPQTPEVSRAAFEAALEGVDVVVLSDYDKGALRSPQPLIQMARERGLKVLIDPKGTQFERYRGATLLTPNRHEFEAVAGPMSTDDGFVEAGETLRQSLDLEALLITRGEDGMTLLQPGVPPLHVATEAREVFDVTGAGDTVIATLAGALAAGHPLAEATFLANAAAGLVVAKLGTATVSCEELRTHLSRRHPRRTGVLSPEEAVVETRHAKAQGERVVLTNGCFDLLHPGHIDYLSKARGLGDRLMVLVNSDASVKRLKGPERPINSLAHRMTLLAALSCVDWVTFFDEDTPRDLIGQLLPDILVKGGDYSAISDIAGHDHVLAHGGRVELLSFLDGHSTSAMVDRIQRAGGPVHD